MKCVDIENKLIFYLEGDLKEWDASLFEAHLDHCGKCRKLYNELQNTWSVMDKEKDFDPDHLAYDKIKARLDSEQRTKDAGVRYLQIPQFMRVAAVILLLLLAGFTGVLIGGQYVSNNLVAKQADQYEYYAQEFYLDNYSDESIEYYIMNQNEYENDNGK